MSVPKKKVVLAMSGGVDSSVAAALLLRQGYDVIGCFMRLGTPEGVGDGVEDATACKTDPAAPTGMAASAAMSSNVKKHKQGCCSVLDAGDARRVAQLLDIPFYVLNFQDEFNRVIDYFVGEYNRGRTPNPCVRCNDWLKFGKLAQYAEAVGADYVASGHYARVGPNPTTGEKTLLRGLDHKKDQSYVLFGMPRGHVDRLLLPVGEFEKSEVRAMAEALNLPVFNKPDSQEICFVPDRDYAGLVKRRTPEAFGEGPLVTATGEKLGTHAGHQQFTIGQRKGVGVAFGLPIYVTHIDAATNTVTLGDKDLLMKRTLIARDINVLSRRVGFSPPFTAPRDGGLKPTLPEPIPCTAKIRYNADPEPATVTRTGDDELTVTFDAPQSAITPGQAVVCYAGDAVLCGGWIESAE
ncbi:MAG TPA: tRNA 2-thiouridine(34) synthase MnmA [Tepidisphaeraceae bacterium]|jgi:tRNA-specific 2-thiouridylase